MAVQPSLFIPHGAGPCFFMEWNHGPPGMWDKMAAYLRGIVATLPERPKAILVISGHWEEPVFTVNSAPRPPMLFDYYGFPPHTYELQFPAPGSPELAARVLDLLRADLERTMRLLGVRSVAELDRSLVRFPEAWAAHP